jgi:NOL1/NOP2/fmu family ribosome biogenesis protein
VRNVYEDSTEGLRILRNGLLLGETEKGRFTPSQAMAMAGCKCSSVHLDHDDIRVMKYLKGETIDLKDQNVPDGWCLIHVDSWPLGFGMVKKGVCKNKLQRSWIIH